MHVHWKHQIVALYLCILNFGPGLTFKDLYSVQYGGKKNILTEGLLFQIHFKSLFSFARVRYSVITGNNNCYQEYLLCPILENNL